MKYKLFRKLTKVEEMDSVLLNILANPWDFSCDSILETDDRIIVRYVKRAVELAKPIALKNEAIFYIHSSKKDHTFTKICIYKLEELIDETTKRFSEVLKNQWRIY